LLVEEEQKNIIANNGKGKEAKTEGILTSQSRRSIENIENILEAAVEKNFTKTARFRGNRQ